MKILIVDDNDNHAEDLRKTLLKTKIPIIIERKEEMKLANSSLLALAMMFGVTDLLGANSLLIDELDGVDIKAEYDLIQHKQSNLSARLRRLVVSRFERGDY